jgi:hypothetical protein
LLVFALKQSPQRGPEAFLLLIYLIGFFETFDFNNRHVEIIDAAAKSRQYYNSIVLSLFTGISY